MVFDYSKFLILILKNNLIICYTIKNYKSNSEGSVILNKVSKAIE